MDMAKLATARKAASTTRPVAVLELHRGGEPCGSLKSIKSRNHGVEINGGPPMFVERPGSPWQEN